MQFFKQIHCGLQIRSVFSRPEPEYLKEAYTHIQGEHADKDLSLTRVTFLNHVIALKSAQLFPHTVQLERVMCAKSDRFINS